MFTNYRRIYYDSNQKWCPLPGLLVVIKGPKDLPKNTAPNCVRIDGIGGWVWLSESLNNKPVLLADFCNPWCMRVLSADGVFDTNIDNLKFVVCYSEKIAKRKTI